ncbi:MAG: hypothetical protein JNM02_04260 [Anaerolineales bacterium]|nr:hypothetical protein [Anaerolineales bacterium]
MSDSPANILCKSCGLCCSGHLFAWTRLNASELDSAQSLGLNVIRDNPNLCGFTQPCSQWSGTCAVYLSPNYPRSCKTYKCTTLRRLLDEDISLPDALTVIQETLSLIREIEPLLPASSIPSFRERLMTYKEELESKGNGLDVLEYEFLYKAKVLLTYYEDRFGMDDFIDYEK